MFSDIALYVHGTGSTAFGPLTNSSGVFGDALCRSGSAYSNLELDFGAPGSASTYPYVSNFPSYAEKGYSNPPEVVGTGGVPWGLTIQVMSAFNTLASINFEICTSSSTGATYNGTGNPIASRVLTLAQLEVVGAAYFIPVNPQQVLEFMNFYAALTGSDPTTGTIIAFFGPRQGGEL